MKLVKDVRKNIDFIVDRFCKSVGVKVKEVKYAGPDLDNNGDALGYYLGDGKWELEFQVDDYGQLNVMFYNDDRYKYGYVSEHNKFIKFEDLKNDVEKVVKLIVDVYEKEVK